MITESKNPMDWERSRMICEELRRKDQIHGNKVPYEQGDIVMDRAGRKGKVLHKEFLYHSANMNRDVWKIDVVFKLVIETFTNPKSLRKVECQSRTAS